MDLLLCANLFAGIKPGAAVRRRPASLLATARVSLSINGRRYAAVNNGNGTWSLAAGTFIGLAAGQTYDVEVTFTDGAMNDQITARSGLVILPNATDTPAQEGGNSGQGEAASTTSTNGSLAETGTSVLPWIVFAGMIGTAGVLVYKRARP